MSTHKTIGGRIEGLVKKVEGMKIGFFGSESGATPVLKEQHNEYVDVIIAAIKELEAEKQKAVEDMVSDILNEIKDCNCQSCRKLEFRIAELQTLNPTTSTRTTTSSENAWGGGQFKVVNT